MQDNVDLDMYVYIMKSLNMDINEDFNMRLFTFQLRLFYIKFCKKFKVVHFLDTAVVNDVTPKRMRDLIFSYLIRKQCLHELPVMFYLEKSYILSQRIYKQIYKLEPQTNKILDVL